MFDRNDKKKSGLTALVAEIKDENAGGSSTALARAGLMPQTQMAKLADAVATGSDTKTDAQKLLYFLATYGEGDRLGRYAFSSGELVGLGATKKIIGGSGSAGEEGGASHDHYQEMAPTRALEEAKHLSLSGPRLSGAASFLAGRGYAKLTYDGEFGIDANFHEISLTDEGRAAATGAVARAGKSGRSVDLNPFPDPFDGFGGVGQAPVAVVEREALTAMLARAKVGYSVSHSGSETEGGETTEIKIGFRTTRENARAGGVVGVVFTFDTDGALLGFGPSDVNHNIGPEPVETETETETETEPTP